MNRKAVSRAYKETARPMGVYRVRNLRDGRMLVGRSVDLPSILNRERAQLKLGCHRNVALQRDWNELGPDAFVFEVLDTLTPPDDQSAYDPTDDLRVLEVLWLERLQPFGDGGYMPRPASRT
ncbi:MAG: LuxR family transcriptional regulator [Gemmatimonadetes bacterium]|nr:LuxR family transcriptional regulator [Gemmatimonadota bacterium]